MKNYEEIIMNQLQIFYFSSYTIFWIILRSFSFICCKSTNCTFCFQKVGLSCDGRSFSYLKNATRHWTGVGESSFHQIHKPSQSQAKQERGKKDKKKLRKDLHWKKYTSDLKIGPKDSYRAQGMNGLSTKWSKAPNTCQVLENSDSPGKWVSPQNLWSRGTHEWTW